MRGFKIYRPLGVFYVEIRIGRLQSITVLCWLYMCVVEVHLALN